MVRHNYTDLILPPITFNDGRIITPLAQTYMKPEA